MLQQAIPNWSMNIDDPRAQFMNLSNLVRMNGEVPSICRSFELNRSSTPGPALASRVSVRGSLLANPSVVVS
jgi:hypothetical protein